MPIHDSRQNNNRINSSSSCRVNSTSNNNSNNHRAPSDSGAGTNKSLLISNRQANNGSSASAMSNLSSYSLIDDDHIDDQETINVGNLIIDLESDLEKEKIENEQANAKPNTCTTTTSTNAAPTSSSSNHSFSSNSSSVPSAASTTYGIGGNKASSSTGNVNPISPVKSSLKSFKHSINNNANSNAVDNSNNAINSSNNNGHTVTGRAIFKSLSDERRELKMRITRETKPGKSEHKIVTSPNQKSPTSSSSGGNHNVQSGYSSFCDDIQLQEASKPTQSSSISSTKECGTSTSIGTITEPDCLGPCEPGTSVTLEGIVWQETDGGILVVNVTWRGKTYVGALLDCTKHDWAPPRLCDSPASDIDSKTNKGVRTKRIMTRSNGIGMDEKNLLQTTGKLRNGKGRRILAPNDLASCNKRQRESEKSDNIHNEASLAANAPSNSNSESSPCVPMNIDTTPIESISASNTILDKAGPNSPMLIGCNEPNCSKKYRNMNGLLYHQTHAHGMDNDSSNSAQENNCSSSIKVTDAPKDEHLEDADAQDQIKDPLSPTDEFKRDQDVQKPLINDEIQQDQLSSSELVVKLDDKIAPDLNQKNTIPDPEPRIVKNSDFDRRNLSNLIHHHSDLGRKSPIAIRHTNDHGHGSSSHSTLKPLPGSSSKHTNSAPMPPTTEEGMKPSGTSTGPPPAPHQANCYFNPAFLANTFSPYLSPYFSRAPLPMYDPLAPPTSTNAFLARFMNNVRPPPPPSDSPSRLLSPSIPKNLPFPPFKLEPGGLPPVPTSQMNNPSLSAMSSMSNQPPPLNTGSPHLRMPSQGDPLMPPTSQAPFPPLAGMNPLLGLPGSVNPLGPIGAPQLPSLVDDQIAKQFPRRFN